MLPPLQKHTHTQVCGGGTICERHRHRFVWDGGEEEGLFTMEIAEEDSLRRSLLHSPNKQLKLKRCQLQKPGVRSFTHHVPFLVGKDTELLCQR